MRLARPLAAVMVLVIVAVAGCASAQTAPGGPAAGAAAANIGPASRITIDTDRSVNCTSMESIVKDITAGCKTDKDKAIACFNFMVRMVYIPYIYDRPKEMSGGGLQSVTDPVKNLVVYGSGGCGIQMTMFSTLCHAAGLEARSLNPGFAHVSNEVKWDGKWHWLDVWLPLYLYDEKGEIYSYEELMADRTLAPAAIAAGRHSENFMYNPQDANALKNVTKFGPSGTGVRKVDYAENLTLRPGEQVTWMWGNVGKWYWPEERYACPAFKFPSDKSAKQAFPFWEPYEKPIPGGPHPGGKHIYYRYYGNAVFVSQPALTARGLAEYDMKLDSGSDEGTAANMQVAKDGLALARAGSGSVVIPFVLPYVLADAEIEGETALGEGDQATLDFSIDGGKAWLGNKEIVGGKFGPVSIGKPNSKEFPKGTVSGQYKYLLRVTLKSEKQLAMLKSLKVTNTTMLNFYSRPWLETGKNNVTVTAEGDLAKAPLEVTWKWLEDWTEAKSFTQKADKSGATAVIDAGGSKRPKMVSITIARPAGK